MEQTGNPVFDFKAGHRRRAAALQKWLILGGIFLFLAAGSMALWAVNDNFRSRAAAASFAGLASLLAGIAWGFHWRRKLRANFRREYGSGGRGS